MGLELAAQAVEELSILAAGYRSKEPRRVPRPKSAAVRHTGIVAESVQGDRSYASAIDRLLANGPPQPGKDTW